MEYLFVHDRQGGWWLKIDKGQHYYAYVGDMQVRGGDVLKWNTYDEAYIRACALVGGE